jgi:hypothetical protein
MESSKQRNPSMARARMRRFSYAAGITLLLGLAPVVLAACARTVRTSDVVGLEARLKTLQILEDKEEIRSMLLEFADIVDEADVSALAALEPKLHEGFRMRVVDFAGTEYHFIGAQGLVEEYGAIMSSAQANLATSAIAVEIDGDHATASFTFVNSVEPPPELGVDVDEKVLLMADNTATFVREGGGWKLASIELVHSLAYPGTLPMAGG